MSMFRLKPLALATAGILLSPHAIADETDSGELVAALDPVIVTATRTPQTVDESLASVTVITRDDIEQSEARDLPSLLDRQHGLSMSANGPFGKNTGLFLRGTNSDHTLILIDGVRVGSATTGQAAFQFLPLGDIERIEIVRGPRSSLYGADAIGGVIQIFTRGARMFEGERFSGGLMVGSHRTNEVTAGVDMGNGERDFSIQARKFDTDGIRIHENSARPNGFSNDSVSMRYRQSLGERTTWTLTGMHSTGRTEIANAFDPDTDDFTDFTQQSFASALEIRATDAWSSRLVLGQARDEAETFSDLDDTDTAVFNTRRDHASWQNDLYLSDNLLFTVGTDAQDEHVESTVDFVEESRYNVGAFAQAQWSPWRLDIEVSGRRDKSEAYGYYTTGGAAIGTHVTDTVRIRGSAATAFKAPTFNELYWPFEDFGMFGSFEGNPDLEPEESASYEIGLEGGRDLQWGITAFRTDVDNLIVNVSDNGDMMPQNVNEARIEGIELAARLRDHGGWDIRATGTWQDPVAKGQDGEDDLQLPRRPRRKFTLDFDRDFNRTGMGFSVRHESRRFDDTANTTELDAFTLVDLRARYRLTARLVLSGSLDNAFDTEYETAAGFGSLGRAFFIRLNYRG